MQDPTGTAPSTAATTSATEALLATAARKGFEVRHPFVAYRGADDFFLERSDVYGYVSVGVKTGKVLAFSFRDGRTNELIGKGRGLVAARRTLASVGGGEWA